MNYVFAPIVLILCATGLMACGNSTPESSSSPTPAPQASATPTPATASPTATASSSPTSTPLATKPGATPPTITDNVSDLEPEVGVIQAVQSGDTMCYITFADEAGKQRQTGATFDLCDSSNQYLNQRVRLVYGVRNVSDCPSNEPCGKTRRANVVIKLDPVNAAGRSSAPDSVKLSNGSWQITIGNRNSWTGVNGTGNLSYRGCDANQQCIDLTGGTMTCRQGTCVSNWTNGAYSYVLESPMTDGSSSVASTLTVRKNDQVLTQITNLR